MTCPVCLICTAFFRRERDEDCQLHPEASRFWRDRRPPGAVNEVLSSGEKP